MIEDPKGDSAQYSDETRESVRLAAAEFAAAIELHTSALVNHDPSDVEGLLELNAAVRRAAEAWDDAVWDHTGTLPIAVESDTGDGWAEDDTEVDGADEDAEGVAAETVSVVARWDLAIVDRIALVQAARKADAHLSASEAAALPEVRNYDIAPAIYALVHAFGEPWFDMPGIAVMGGWRGYLMTDGSDILDLQDEDIDVSSYIPTTPDGELLFSEGW